MYTNFCWAYDSFGNRTWQVQSTASISGDGASCSPQSAASNSGYNRLYTASNQVDHDVTLTGTNVGSPVTYDPLGSGNVIEDGANGLAPQHGYLYDAEDRICAVELPPAIVGQPNQMIQYLYDADGNRIGKGTITVWSCNIDQPNGFQLTNEYVLGQAGEQVTEFATADITPANPTGWAHTNAYAGGQLVATYDTAGNTLTYQTAALHYQIADWLGSRRVQTNAAGMVEYGYLSLPFGDGLTPVPNPNCLSTNYCYSEDPTEHHFTGKERDSESGNDYFGARYYASNMGRWMSPDWSAKEDPIPYAHLDDPQSLNLYSYVLNNPLAEPDLDGHGCPPDCGDPTAPTAVAPPPPSLLDRFRDFNVAMANKAVELLNHPVIQAYLSVIPGLGPEAGAVEEVESGVAGGFADAAAFNKFSSTLSSGLGNIDAGGSAFLTGSAVTGKSFTTGAAFDVGRVSDFDVAVVSPKLLGEAKDLGLGLRSGGARTGPLDANALKSLGLSNLSQTLSKQAGRPVNFMVYGTEDALKARGNPYIPLK
jgi:RHS repeat-associated protein